MDGRVGRPRLLAVIPARGGSKRFPRKNMALFRGRPLLALAMDCALESGIFETVCVSSDDAEMLALAQARPGVSAIPRPAELAGDRATLIQVCQALLAQLADAGQTYEAFALLIPTSPLRTADDLRRAAAAFRPRDFDLLMSLVPYAHPPQRALCIRDGLAAGYWGEGQMLQAQQLEPLYRHDGTVILATAASFRADPRFYGRRIQPFLMPSERSADIDSPLDLAWAELLWSRQAARSGDD